MVGGGRPTLGEDAILSAELGDGDVEKVSRGDLCVDVAAPVPDVDLRAGEVVTYAHSSASSRKSPYVRPKIIEVPSGAVR